MSLIEEALDQWKGEPPDALRAGGRDWPLDEARNLRDAFRVRLANLFRMPRPDWCVDKVSRGAIGPAAFNARFNVPRALWFELGIRRYATANYDFELERVGMLADLTADDESKVHDRRSTFELLRQLWRERSDNFLWDLGSGRIRRVFDDGWAIESDLLNRERIDRMIEFAVGTDDVDGHIMHLHGRACNWHSMILTQRDYDALYRRNDLNRVPFEFARRMMMGGNPILFVGLGMKEQELNSEMQEFISNAPYQRAAPTFLLWSGADLEDHERKAKRLQFLRTLGVLTIFDTDFDPPSTVKAKPRQPKKSIYQIANSGWSKLLKAPKPVGYSGVLEKIKRRARNSEKNATPASKGSGQLRKLESLVTGIDKLVVGQKAAVDTVPDIVFRNPTRRELHIGKSWRCMAGRIRAAREARQPVILWDADFKRDATPPKWMDPLFAKIATGQSCCVIGPQGCGKGQVARWLVEDLQGRTGIVHPHHRMLINGSFSFDTDTLLDGVSRFLSEVLGVPLTDAADHDRPLMSRHQAFEMFDLTQLYAGQPHALIIVNGSERFFDIEGRPLSAELDQFLQLCAKAEQAGQAAREDGQLAAVPRLSLVLFGTERVRAQMDKHGIPTLDMPQLMGREAREEIAQRRRMPGWYFDELWRAADDRGVRWGAAIVGATTKYEGLSSGKISGDSISLRQALFGSIFDDENLGKLLRGKPGRPERRDLVPAARAVLRALAFIGLPVTLEALLQMPALASHGKNAKYALIALQRCRLVIMLHRYTPRDSSARRKRYRLALHRSLLTELRFRFGIPLSEAKLSTAFNMSLYVAQPIDGDIPDTDIHEELGESIDKLINSYRRDAADPDLKIRQVALRLGVAGGEAFKAILRAALMACGDAKLHAPDDRDLVAMLAICGDTYADALRTALALVRSYYTTTGLLTLDSGDRIVREGHDGLLLEHAERLDDLIDAYGKRSLAREKLEELLVSQIGAALEKAEPSWSESKRGSEARQRMRTEIGNVDPFYAEDLIWLHNERGVVRLAMGDLYEARRSFEHALRVNREWVERDDRAHNWRRIMLNLILVDIEQGRFVPAERRCAEIRSILPAQCLREDRLATAIVGGYEAWCLQLRGRTVLGLAKLDKVCPQLAKLGEVRAQAFFERLRADAMGAARLPNAERQRIIERALDLAQSARQMDIVHRLQLSLADTMMFGAGTTGGEQQRMALRFMDEALTYALHTEVHRVRCEASMMIARARLLMSDFEGALRFASDALMIATRYGMELRKISLRATIAKIMAARGHPVTAEHLARTCIKIATRYSYQTAIDKASQVIHEIPRLSSAISTSDHSGRRHF